MDGIAFALLGAGAAAAWVTKRGARRHLPQHCPVQRERPFLLAREGSGDERRGGHRIDSGRDVCDGGVNDGQAHGGLPR